MSSKTRTFFLNTVSVVLTAVIIRVAGVLFSIYISNYVGSEAMGLYSLIMSVYGFSITIACAGVNLGTIRLVSDALGKNNVRMAISAVRKALGYCTVSSAIASLLLYLGADVLSTYVLGDTRATIPMRILALTLLPIAICSCLSGYFVAVKRVKLSSVIQIAVQLCKITFTLLFFSMFLERSAEIACIALAAGGVISELLSLIITYLLYVFDLKKMRSMDANKNVGGISLSQDNSISSKRLIGITLPVTFSACIRSALTMVQHVLVPQGIKSSGLSWSEALSTYGSLHGMALPLVLFPSVFVSSCAGLLVPEISECLVQNNKDRLSRVAYRSLSLSLFFSIGISGIMIFFSRDLGQTIYNNQDVGYYIAIIAPLIPVMYIDSAVDAILKGSGHHVYSMNINIVDTLVSCLLAIILLPRYGIHGYILSIYITEILNTSLSLSKMISVSGMRPKIFHQIIMPIVCIIAATNISNLILTKADHILKGGLDLTVHVIISAIIYVTLLFITKTIGDSEKEFLNASLLPESVYNKKFSHYTVIVSQKEISAK